MRIITLFAILAISLPVMANLPTALDQQLVDRTLAVFVVKS